MKMLIKNHLRMTTDEAEDRIGKNYDADAIDFDKINNAILAIADEFADGIAKQFPQKFKVSVTNEYQSATTSFK